MAGRHDDVDPPELADILFHGDSPDYDRYAAELFYEGVIHDNEKAYGELLEYLDYQYDIDFEAEFAWADFDSPTVK